MNQGIAEFRANRRVELVRRGRKLDYLTIAYNSCEGLIGIIAGLLAGSIATRRVRLR